MMNEQQTGPAGWRLSAGGVTPHGFGKLQAQAFLKRPARHALTKVAVDTPLSTKPQRPEALSMRERGSRVDRSSQPLPLAPSKISVLFKILFLLLKSFCKRSVFFLKNKNECQNSMNVFRRALCLAAEKVSVLIHNCNQN